MEGVRIGGEVAQSNRHAAPAEPSRDRRWPGSAILRMSAPPSEVRVVEWLGPALGDGVDPRSQPNSFEPMVLPVSGTSTSLADAVRASSPSRDRARPQLHASGMSWATAGQTSQASFSWSLLSTYGSASASQ